MIKRLGLFLGYPPYTPDSEVVQGVIIFCYIDIFVSVVGWGWCRGLLEWLGLL